MHLRASGATTWSASLTKTSNDHWNVSKQWLILKMCTFLQQMENEESDSEEDVIFCCASWTTSLIEWTGTMSVNVLCSFHKCKWFWVSDCLGPFVTSSWKTLPSGVEGHDLRCKKHFRSTSMCFRAALPSCAKQPKLRFFRLHKLNCWLHKVTNARMRWHAATKLSSRTIMHSCAVTHWQMWTLWKWQTASDWLWIVMLRFEAFLCAIRKTSLSSERSNANQSVFKCSINNG